jgi:hypothetical protein
MEAMRSMVSSKSNPVRRDFWNVSSVVFELVAGVLLKPGGWVDLNEFLGGVFLG